MTSPHLPVAVLWDMDGTLIDSEPYWMGAETSLAADHGLTWTEQDSIDMVGKPLSVAAQILIDHGVRDTPQAIIDRLLNEVAGHVRAHVPWQNDARALLDQVVAANIPCALVTMSFGAVTEAFLAAAPPVFDVIVTGDQMARGKPDPEGYLTAASRLGVDIAQCVAIEDSPGGVQSAYSSGAKTIAVRRLAPVAPQPGLTRVRSLAGVTVETLARVRGGHHFDELGEEH